MWTHSLPRLWNCQRLCSTHTSRRPRSSVRAAPVSDDESREQGAFANLDSISLDSGDSWSSERQPGSQRSTSNAAGMCISATFDSGNIDVVDMRYPWDIQLRIRPDPFCVADDRASLQWFYFRLTGAKGLPLTLKFVNASEASYPEGWEGYDAVASYDMTSWFRVPSEYRDSVFTIRHTPVHHAIFYAYFAPYTMDRHMQLISELQMKEFVTPCVLCETVDGHDLDMLIIGKEEPRDTRKKKVIWVIARQHPGESMAEWFVEGFLRRLTDRHDSVGRNLIESQAVIYVVPNMNPDGSWRGHMRTDGNGVNMNRAWQNPEGVPSVLHVLRKMRETGVDMFVDVHGDSVCPHNFIVGAEGIPSYTDHMARCKEHFTQTLLRAHPAFQTEVGDPVDAPGTANMSRATKAIAEEFGCFAVTLEQPFKDCVEHPDPEFGWSPQRAMRFGGSFVSAVRQMVPLL